VRPSLVAWIGAALWEEEGSDGTVAPCYLRGFGERARDALP